MSEQQPILYNFYMSPPVRSVKVVARLIELDLEFRYAFYLACNLFLFMFHFDLQRFGYFKWRAFARNIHQCK